MMKRVNVEVNLWLWTKSGPLFSLVSCLYAKIS